MNIQLLDCTLRDGGHVINSQFGEQIIKGIISKLVKSKVEIIELGFLRDVAYDKDIAVFNQIEQAEKLIEKYSHKDSEFSLLVQQDQYDYHNLPKNSGKINYIRVSFHINDRMEGLEFCQNVVEKGYRCSCNPINIMGYSDLELLDLIERVNEIEPYTFSIVDTFGAMQQEDLLRIYQLLSHNLKPQINIGIHLHENMSQSYSLAQAITRMNLMGRKLTIDASLRGMGRVPGNLPVELIMDYMNKFCEKNYDINYALDAIDNYINVFYYQILWGYDPVYSLAAQYNLHRTYAEFLKNTGKLGTKDIHNILKEIPAEKRTLYDEKYIRQAYLTYMSVKVDDEYALQKLREEMYQKEILVIANGHSIVSEQETIDDFIQKHPQLVIISANFYCNDRDYNYAFFSNIRRYSSMVEKDCEKTILSSNISREMEGNELVINYDKLIVPDEQVGDNCMIMILNLLHLLQADKIYLAGFDGYANNTNDYFAAMYNNTRQPDNINFQIRECLKKNFKMSDVKFITGSKYDEK